MTRKTRTPIWLNALDWLAEKNGQYRQARKLEEMPDERPKARPDCAAARRPPRQRRRQWASPVS